MPDLIFHVDTLTSRAFHGNPVTVCILENQRDRAWMHELSRAMNTPESAFVLPRKTSHARSPNRFDLRAMAGGSEVEIAASATLAAAHVLFTRSKANSSKVGSFVDPRRSIVFFTRGGPVPASMEDGMLEINFPALLLEELSDPPEEILQGIDPAPEYVGRRGNDYLVQVSSEARLHEVRPDFHFLRGMGMRGLIVTSIADQTTSHDFVSRTFHIPRPLEDPIASYAPFVLAPFWFLRLGKTILKNMAYSANRTGRARMIGHSGATRPQGSRRKAGHQFQLIIEGDRVKLIGEAVTVFEGELKL
ncbi:MAG TPA: PhzF family phenazine biosynthesis protein [Candidatus Kapabacteria bacterium]|nr:PhzF family phenazine biosynthesis protein [Candidatus Kapabacteria bacterium]